MRAFVHEAVRSLFADARASANDNDDAAREFFFRRHALEFSFFEEPVFDVERFLLREGDVAVDGFRTAHDFDGAVVKFRSDARFAFVLAPGDHAEARNQHHGGIRVAHGRGIGPLALLIIGRVIDAILGDAVSKFLFQRGDIFGLRIPVDVERFDFRAQEMVRAGSAQLGQAGGVTAIDEALDLFVVLHGADETLAL